MKRFIKVILIASVLALFAVLSASALAAAGSGEPVTSGAPPVPSTPKVYYFTWYDSRPADGMSGDWIVIGNLEDYSATAQVYFGNETTARETLQIAPHDRQLVSWPETMGGPVRVVSPDGATFVVTQRVLYGDTFNEVGAIEQSNLDTSYNFTWYDSLAANGMKGDWILVANPGPLAAEVKIFIAGSEMGSYSIAPGEKVTPQFNNVMGGPVEVKSMNGQPIIVSQRTLWGGSFNEVMGMPGSSLDTIYYFTWYDMLSTGMKGNWVLISNITDATVHAQVFVGEGASPRGTYEIGPHSSVTPTYPGTMDGPVRVVCADCAPGQNILVSQRVLYSDSFEEVQGTPPAGLTEREFFGWYDFTAANSMRGNWLLVANLGIGDTIADVYIGTSATPIATFTIPEGGRVTPQFPEVLGGPVRVLSRNNQPLMVSQRTIYKNSFNELLGLTKDDVGQPAAPGPDMRLYKIATYWKDMTDYQNRLLSVDLRIANPGLGTAVGTTVTSVTADNGVTAATATPLPLGNLAAAGGHADFTVQFNVPASVTAFHTHLNAQCQDSVGNWYYYPPGP